MSDYDGMFDGGFQRGSFEVSQKRRRGNSAVVGSAPFVPLVGASIDMDFVGGNYFGGTLATLMNPGQTQAIGALLTALLTLTGGSLVISLNALGVSPNGSTFWICDSNSNNAFIYGQSATLVRSQAGFGVNRITATLGGASTFAAPSKIGVSWSAAGRSLVANNGTVVTSVVNFGAGEVDCFFNLPVLTNFKRLTYWNTKLSDAALAALTV